MMDNMNIRENANVLIERWDDGRFVVVKNRYETRRTPYLIDPCEAIELTAKHQKVVIVNWHASGNTGVYGEANESKLENLCCEVSQPQYVRVSWWL